MTPFSQHAIQNSEAGFSKFSPATLSKRPECLGGMKGEINNLNYPNGVILQSFTYFFPSRKEAVSTDQQCSHQALQEMPQLHLGHLT